MKQKKSVEDYLKIIYILSGTMLEVPVGTGVLTMPVYETLPEADVTCLDYSPDMMERAKRQAKKRGLENVRFMQGDVRKLPFDDDSFDLVLSLNGFHAFPDKEAAYRKVFRVLKPGGRLILRDMASNSRILMWFFNHIEIPAANRFLNKGDVRVYSRDAIQRLCDAGGLKLELYEVRKGFRLHCVVRKPCTEKRK